MKDNPRLVTVAIAAILVTAVADAILIFSGHDASDVIGGKWVEYWAAFATVWNIVIIAIAKYAGEKLLRKPSDYYEDKDE